MAIATGFRHDLFVSYAHADDTPSVGCAQGFVSQFVADLRAEVGRKLGAALDVWWDRHDLAGNIPVTPEIVQAASEAAGIVVLVSPAYLRSEWCQRERSTFLAALRRRAGSGAVFLVAIEGLARERLPEEFHDLVGYQFWKPLADGHATRPLRVEFADDRQPYYDRLCQLVQSIADHLDGIVRRGVDPQRSIVLPSDDAPRIVLAEVTDDLLHQREDVKTYLEQLGFVVLPRRRYSRDDLALHRRQLREDLEQARIFVQLLGPLPGDKSDEAKGMAWLRWASAQDVLPSERIVQWRDPQLDPANVADADAQALLKLPTVRSCGLPELKRAVAELLQSKDRKAPAPRPDAPKSVFVNADLLDRGFAAEISHWFAEQGYFVLEPPSASDPIERQKVWKTNLELCQSLILVFGQTQPSWINQQMMLSVKVLALREEPIELMSICVGPPPKASADGGRTAPIKHRALEYLNCENGLDPAELARFSALLESGHAV